MKAGLVAVVAVVTLVCLAAPSAARAHVFIHRPPADLVQGDGIFVGVWYQASSGGPRQIRARVYFRSRKVADKPIRATRRWRYHFLCGCERVGRYKLRITGAGWNRTFRIRMRPEGV